VEWRVDSYSDLSDSSVLEAARALRSVTDRRPILFTLRIKAEGGARQISQDVRAQCIHTALRSGLVDIVDVELCNGPQFLQPIIEAAHHRAVRVVLSYHDFESTSGNDVLFERISEMIRQGADIAKIACMPRQPEDVLRLLHATLTARQAFPGVPLCTMSMGELGSWSRVVGFLYGSDMAFAVGQEASAPGQIPIAKARAMAETLFG